MIIKRFFECYIPVTQCNLECGYCYIIQEGRRKLENPPLNFPIGIMMKSLNKERLGGSCFFSICGGGETLIPDYITPITHGLLKEGHIVNLTNNGTMSKRIDELLNIEDKSLLKYLMFSFSFHYLELKKRNLLDIFFNNVRKVKEAGCSFYIKLNLYDGYIPYIDEIKDICMKNVGAYPQVAVSRNELRSDFYTMHTSNKEEYYKAGHSFNSSLFEFTYSHFMEKRKEFCYAGDWTLLLNLQTGNMHKCYGNYEDSINIFEDPNKPIKFKAVGNNCHYPICVNDCHFLALGSIPELNDIPSYFELRNREGVNWFNNEMKDILSKKLYFYNKQYSKVKKDMINESYKRRLRINSLKAKIKRNLKIK